MTEQPRKSVNASRDAILRTWPMSAPVQTTGDIARRIGEPIPDAHIALSSMESKGLVVGESFGRVEAYRITYSGRLFQRSISTGAAPKGGAA